MQNGNSRFDTHPDLADSKKLRKCTRRRHPHTTATGTSELQLQYTSNYHAAVLLGVLGKEQMYKTVPEHLAAFVQGKRATLGDCDLGNCAAITLKGRQEDKL